MAPTSRNARGHLIAAAFAAAALFAPAPSSAVQPTLTPKVLQCDGSFAAGTITSHPAPTILVEAQSTNPGLKVGQRRLSVLPTSTLALWRFDGNFTVTVSSCYTGGCNSGFDSCRTWTYQYIDSNGSSSLRTGQCTYRDTTTAGCTESMTLYGLGSNHVPVPVGGAACPASTTTLPSASGSVAITPTGPLAGLATSGLSAQALQLNGSSLYASTTNSANWDLPASYTLAAWVKPSTFNGRIVSQQGATGYWGIGVGATGGLRHFDSRDATPGPDLERGSGLTAAGTLAGWHLVHLVRRNGIDRRFYIDGRLVGTAVAASTNSFSSHPNNATLEIGRYSGGSEYFNGSIDDVRIVNTTLTDDDIMLEWTTQFHKYSSDAGVTFSTAGGTYAGSPVNGTTAVVTYSTAGAVPVEPWTTNGRWQFVGQSIDGETGYSTSYGVTIDVSSPIAPSLTAVATSPNDITWSWGTPPRVCLPPGSTSVSYQLVDAPTGATLIPPGSMLYPTSNVGENIAGGSNQLVGRKLRVTDVWGSGLSVATSIYTLANPPLAASVVPSSISTGSALISWNQNGNPTYTRYLVAISQDPTFATGVSTPATVASDLTGSSITIPILAIGTTYYVRVQSVSGRSSDGFGGAGSVFVSTSFTTLPGAPNLGGTPNGVANEITWNWTAVPGAQYYKLFDVAGSTLYTGGNLTFTQTGLGTNAQYTSRVEAVSANGGGQRAAATAFTLANNPTAPTVNAAYASSITYSWNGGVNPSYTFYEIAVTTDATYGIIVTTLTVNATTATATGLFPGTTYYARVRSVNGSQVYGTAYAVFAATRTIPDPSVTSVLAPPSAYVPPGGSVGQWHFDESTGTSAADSSGFTNPALLTCVTALCTSTPTFIAGPAGLGAAASFSGLAGSLARVPDAAQYAFTGSMTVSAWVNPSSLFQPNGAGIVVRGSATAENFALDVSSGLYRFSPKPGFIAASTKTVSAGTWIHLIGSYDASVGSATLYVNGRPASTVLAVPVRTAANHDITIGNRQSGVTAYDRGFLGGIDAVRVQSRALNAAEALAEFEGSYVSTVTPPSPNNGIMIGLAPNAFGAPATISVSVDPLAHPITVTAAVLNEGLTVIPTGFTLVPNSLIEIVPIVSGTPFTQTLGSSASVSMPYVDANGDNIIDGSNPPLAASAIKVYTLNTTVNRWELLPTYVDPTTRRVTFFTPHFSVFAMFAPLTIGTSLAQVRVYPVPWKPGSNGRFDAAGVTFDRLPASGVVRILSLAGERVREFAFDGSSAGSVVWNGVTDGGQRAASGVYFARITGGGGESIVKFAIER